MLRKYTALFAIFLSYAILLGHSIIPHHHHDNKIKHAEQPHHSEYACDFAKVNLQGELGFDFFQQPLDSNLPSYHSIDETFSRTQISFVAIFPDNFTFTGLIKMPLLHKQALEQLLFISPPFHASGRRAPPVLSV